MLPYTNGQTDASAQTLASAVLARARHDNATVVLLSEMISLDPLDLAFHLIKQNDQEPLRIVILGAASDLAYSRELYVHRKPDAELKDESAFSRVFTVDIAGREILADGVRVSCSPTELRLLTFFLRYPGVVFSRTELLRRICTSFPLVKPRMIDVLVRRLRRKIEAVPASPAHLLTVSGVGYLFQHNSDVFLDYLTGQRFLSWPPSSFEDL